MFQIGPVGMNSWAWEKAVYGKYGIHKTCIQEQSLVEMPNSDYQTFRV